jgi:hypothetical protein
MVLWRVVKARWALSVVAILSALSGCRTMHGYAQPRLRYDVVVGEGCKPFRHSCLGSLPPLGALELKRCEGATIWIRSLRASTYTTPAPMHVVLDTVDEGGRPAPGQVEPHELDTDESGYNGQVIRFTSEHIGVFHVRATFTDGDGSVVVASYGPPIIVSGGIATPEACSDALQSPYSEPNAANVLADIGAHGGLGAAEADGHVAASLQVGTEPLRLSEAPRLLIGASLWAGASAGRNFLSIGPSASISVLLSEHLVSGVRLLPAFLWDHLSDDSHHIGGAVLGSPYLFWRPSGDVGFGLALVVGGRVIPVGNVPLFWGATLGTFL